MRSWNRGSEYECTFRTEGREQSRRLLSRWPHTADSGTARTPLTVRVADSYCSHETQQYYLIYTQFNTILYNVTRAHVLSGLRDSPCYFTAVLDLSVEPRAELCASGAGDARQSLRLGQELTVRLIIEATRFLGRGIESEREGSGSAGLKLRRAPTDAPSDRSEHTRCQSLHVQLSCV